MWNLEIWMFGGGGLYLKKSFGEGASPFLKHYKSEMDREQILVFGSKTELIDTDEIWKFGWRAWLMHGLQGPRT